MPSSTAVRTTRIREVAAAMGVALAVLAGLGSISTVAEEPAEHAGPANSLAGETSPYLLLHAHDPVEWRPWGPEAFAKAKAENKPIFLSIGYSSCFWCHVMQRESFRDPAVAKLLNDHFISIKVDREERPDVDQVYMAALQAFSTGGWPMSMFLLPDGRPFFGGTYFPPRDKPGFTGFETVLAGVAKSWREEHAEIERAAAGLTEIVRRKLGKGASRRKVPLGPEVVAEGRSQLADQFDPEYGGFGFNPGNARRPKFPEPVNLVFLLDQHRRDPAKAPASPTSAPSNRDPLTMSLFTLDHMARGGVRDQLGGGYHRYATSRFWIVPHFEKMLYDNAQLASVHLQAFELTGDPRWRDEAGATFAFIDRTMTSPEGGFYSSLDAETKAGEGAYYVWTPDEVKQVLGAGPDADAFIQVYGLKREPNFEGDRYVLLEPRPRAEQAESFKTTPAELERRLAPLRAKLLKARDQRPGPSRDDKILTAWNGLMIAAYADGYRVLKDDRLLRAAEKAADFLLDKLRDPSGRLLRTYRAGQARLPAYLEDYAYLAHGLLRLHEAAKDGRRLEQARALTDRMIADFADEQDGGFFFTADDHESLLARSKDPLDGALPSANGIAVLNLMALHRADAGETRYLDLAGKTLDAFSPFLAQNPASMPIMLVGLLEYHDVRPPQKPAPGASADAPKVVSAQAKVVEGQKPKAGGAVAVVVSLAIQSGWHVYANPTGQEFLKPTTITLEAGQPAESIRVDYPGGKAQTLASVSPEPVSLYEGKVEIPLRFRLTKAAAPGKLRVLLRLKFQACDDKVCLAPASLVVPVDLTIAP
ncbi:DUF255 domain-containing protein [Paludisphaera borealis]|uniref:Thioredoxin domain-containing protein n=1 Tax=Paludisphaera borealis TaxID=1387353 RepID=A0A1U7CJG2_9BACT|nr:DUF255 domain-containing protein [Paludisphaera borealis]APW59080.1 hypothetical protein BSF38_00494 [Paludisphaera borealis]